MNETLDFLGLDSVRCEDILEIIEGYKGLGYGLSRKEELGRFFNFLTNCN